jgi:NADH:ubiquinone reductase (H+-translocating)
MAIEKPHHVVIVGCGFAGLFATYALRRAPVTVTIIDRTNHHLFQPLLYQVATGVLSEGDIAPPIREVVSGQSNVRVLLGEVVDVDLGARLVRTSALGQSGTVEYDSLIVATGAAQSYFGHPEFAEHAPGMKTIDDALELRGRIFGAFELAEGESDPERRRAWLTFAIVGAGPTGVELAGQLRELSRRSLQHNFQNIEPHEARVVLIDALNTVLPAFHPSLRERAARDLRELGVELQLGTRVTGVDAISLDLQPSDGPSVRLEARTKIWAAGVEASPLGRLLASATGAPTDRSGRIEVLPDCTLPGHPEVFVVGDLMKLNNHSGVAEVAMQSGWHAARTIVRRLRGSTEPRPFVYRDFGTLATIARFRAVADLGWLRLTGAPAWIFWLVIHVTFLTGFKNRLAALTNWAFAFLGRRRRQRTITLQQVIARSVLASRLQDSDQPSGKQSL